MPKQQLQQGEKTRRKIEKARINNHLHHPTVSGAAPTQPGSADTISASIAPQTSATEASGSSHTDVSPPPRTQREILKDLMDRFFGS